MKKQLSKWASKWALITDSNVENLYGKALEEKLKAGGLDVELFSFPSGELFKTRETKQNLEDALFSKGYGSDSGILALGGGVVTDLAGFLAATYCRGVPLVLVPTTLLGMVDASLGGKTGVNLPFGKNLVGVVYEPKETFLDLNYLNTLPLKEMKNGVVEMIKHGFIADLDHFTYLEEEVWTVDWERAILESRAIKKRIIKNNQRDLLNAGHTVGHAIEKVSGFSLSHGEAVAIGLMVEAMLSFKKGLLPRASLARLENIFEKFQISLSMPRLSKKDLIRSMELDKKSVDGKARFVLMCDIASPLECRSVEEPVLEDCLDALCCY